MKRVTIIMLMAFLIPAVPCFAASHFSCRPIDTPEQAALYSARIVSTFGVGSAGFDPQGGVNGTGAFRIVKTGDLGSASGVKGDRMNTSEDITLREGYTYYFSALVNSEASDARFAYALEGLNQNLTGIETCGQTATPFVDVNTLYPSVAKGAWSRFTAGAWGNLRWALTVEKGTATNVRPFIVIAGGTNITTELKPGAGESYPLSYWLDNRHILEVPNGDLTADVLPVVTNVALDKTTATAGESLTVSADCYDVNPNVTPSLNYRWQRFDGNQWVTIEGAQGASYTARLGDGKIRAVVTAESANTAGAVEGDTVYSPEATVQQSEITISFAFTGAEGLESVSYQVNGASAVPVTGEGVLLASGDELSISFVPAAGWEVTKVTYQQVDYPVINDAVTLTLSDSGEIAATMIQRQAALPQFTTSSQVWEPDYVRNDYNGYSAVAYVGMNLGYGYTITDMGCLFYSDDATIAPLRLSSASKVDKFGIRAYGNIFSKPGTYYMRPYIEVEGREELILGDIYTFAVE